MYLILLYHCNIAASNWASYVVRCRLTYSPHKHGVVVVTSFHMHSILRCYSRVELLQILLCVPVWAAYELHGHSSRYVHSPLALKLIVTKFTQPISKSLYMNEHALQHSAGMVILDVPYYSYFGGYGATNY